MADAQVSQRIVEIGHGFTGIQVEVSQMLVEIAYRDPTKIGFVSQHLIEIAYESGDDVHGPAIQLI